MGVASRLRVLVVEDDQDLREMMIEALDDAGMDARGAGCAADARVALGEAPADVITIDLSLGDASGIDLARELRAECEDAQLVVVTGRVEPDLREAALDAGCASVLLKPVWPADLVREIEALRTRDA